MQQYTTLLINNIYVWTATKSPDCKLDVDQCSPEDPIQLLKDLFHPKLRLIYFSQCQLVVPHLSMKIKVF